MKATLRSSKKKKKPFHACFLLPQHTKNKLNEETQYKLFDLCFFKQSIFFIRKDYAVLQALSFWCKKNPIPKRNIS